MDVKRDKKYPTNGHSGDSGADSQRLDQEVKGL